MTSLHDEVWRYEGSETDRVPCCMVTESEWTWFGSVVVTLALLAVFNLKYYRKIVSKPKNLHKEENEKVLKDYLLAHQNGAACQLPTGPISLNEFKKAYQDRQKHPVIFKLEFSAGVAADQDIPALTGNRDENLSLNRNPGIVPFDVNLVGGVYINASYVNGYNNQNYIVTQGPLDVTVSAFWRMVWNENVPAVVMLTKTFDFIKVMCVQYWPALGTEERYGDLIVRTLSETRFSDFTERRIQVELATKGSEGLDGKDSQRREIIQHHYTEWSCYGSPVEETFLDFRRRVANTLSSTSNTGPCVVHCSDGGGRSGVFVLLDYNIRLYESENLVDICSMFSMLRRQRRGLIETEEQYRLVYTLLNRHIQTPQTIRGKVELDWLRENGISEDELKAEYLLVKGLVRPLTQGDCAGAHREDNRDKNRHLHTLPPDAHRPYITSFQDNSFTDYINAVFVDGFLRSKEFIVTEWPLLHTVKDFWSMIYDHKVGSIVVLEDRLKVGGSRFPRFWPDQGTQAEYGPAFIVKRSAEAEAEKVEEDGRQTPDHFSAFNLQIRRRVVVLHRKTQAPWVGENQGWQVASVPSMVAGAVVGRTEVPARSARLFKVNNWPAGLVPMLHGLKEWEREQGVPGRVCVVSQDGVSRVGVYTLLSYAKDQLDREQQINTIQGATTIKNHRPGLLNDIQEYRLFYQLLSQIY